MPGSWRVEGVRAALELGRYGGLGGRFGLVGLDRVEDGPARRLGSLVPAGVPHRLGHVLRLVPRLALRLRCGLTRLVSCRIGLALSLRGVVAEVGVRVRVSLRLPA